MTAAMGVCRGFFLRLPAPSRMLTLEGLVIVDSILSALGLEG
jgi:hypothetical protein